MLVGDERVQPFLALDGEAVRMIRASSLPFPSTITTYVALCEATHGRGWVTASLDGLADNTGLSKPTLTQALHGLIGLGLLQKHERRNDSGEKLPNQYLLLFPQDC